MRSPILSAIDAGHKGAYVVSHHINSPGLLVIEDFLTQFRDDLENRGCKFVIASLFREPVAREVSSYLKFHVDVPFTEDLSSVLKEEPAFPVLGGGGGAFEQSREFLFMDMCCGYDTLEAIQEKERNVPGFAANMAWNKQRGFVYHTNSLSSFAHVLRPHVTQCIIRALITSPSQSKTNETINSIKEE